MATADDCDSLRTESVRTFVRPFHLQARKIIQAKGPLVHANALLIRKRMERRAARAEENSVQSTGREGGLRPVRIRLLQVLRGRAVLRHGIAPGGGRNRKGRVWRDTTFRVPGEESDVARFMKVQRFFRRSLRIVQVYPVRHCLPQRLQLLR